MTPLVLKYIHSAEAPQSVFLEPTVAAVIEMTENTLDARVARLESDVSFIRTDVADVKTDLRQMRGEMNNGFTEVRAEIARQFRWLVGLMITMVLTVLAAVGGVIATAIRWH